MNAWWRRLAVATLAGALPLIAAGYSGEPAATGAITPASLSTSLTLSEPSSAVPEELVGTWVSTGSGNAKQLYRFLPDGRYGYAGILRQQRPSGQASYEIEAAGRMQVAGSRLVLQPISGYQILNDPDSPGGGSKRPIKKDQEIYTWQLSAANALALTDAEGNTITYHRE